MYYLNLASGLNSFQSLVPRKGREEIVLPFSDAILEEQ